MKNHQNSLKTLLKDDQNDLDLHCAETPPVSSGFCKDNHDIIVWRPVLLMARRHHGYLCKNLPECGPAGSISGSYLKPPWGSSEHCDGRRYRDRPLSKKECYWRDLNFNSRQHVEFIGVPTVAEPQHRWCAFDSSTNPRLVLIFVYIKTSLFRCRNQVRHDLPMNLG